MDAGTEGIKGEGNFEGLRMASYFGRLNYAFADKYLFEMNLPVPMPPLVLNGEIAG